MRSYKDSIQFVKAVADNDRFEIKHELVSLFFFLNGDETEINKAVDYAIEKSSFKVEPHDPHKTEGNSEFNEDYFAQVSTNLTKNFSKERLNLLLSIYDKVYKHKESVRFDEFYASSKTSPYKTIAIATGAVLAIYLLYKIFSQ